MFARERAVKVLLDAPDIAAIYQRLAEAERRLEPEPERKSAQR